MQASKHAGAADAADTGGAFFVIRGLAVLVLPTPTPSPTHILAVFSRFGGLAGPWGWQLGGFQNVAHAK